ncbi:hypothetical protein K32_18500 [Kaistia sp. 32K]|uniref:hypothetical protein n=1 Tax=Kaistia sp. 32K TaxID=2795690 RepID=UPI0019160F1A|nr:hypothetical protein [Kaistia sp. 32K]BCP53233.1 hypothetical protein K32_18500 [Kaistia sp. 32K]
MVKSVARPAVAKPSLAKPSLGTRTLEFGSSFAAGAMMLSRMNCSELSRYDDLVSDLCRLRAPPGGPSPEPKEATLPPRRRWRLWGVTKVHSSR